MNSVENGAAEAANDTTVSEQVADKPVVEREEGADDQTEGQDKLGEDEEELDVDGEKFRIPRKLREAIAKPMLSDYTRKTQAHADAIKAFEGEKEGFGKTRAAQQAHFQEAAKVIAFNDRLAELEGDTGLGRYKNVDWLTLSQTNPEAYTQHRALFDSLKDQRDGLRNQRDAAARTWSEKEQEYASNANRERGERVAKAQVEIAKQVEGWAPGNELDLTLVKYGNSKGLSATDMGELAIRAPVLVKLLNEHRVFSEAAAKLKKQQSFEESQAAKPVRTVTGTGGSAARKTTDASGDQLSTEEWMKRERERMRKRG